jgi:hypothetical protein
MAPERHEQGRWSKKHGEESRGPARDPAAGLDYIDPPARDVLIAARTMGEPDLPLAFCAGPPGDAVNGESRS